MDTFDLDGGFALRTTDEQIMIDTLMRTVFSPNGSLVQEHLCLTQFGFGRYTEGHALLRYIRNETARFIRYAPDHFIVDRKKPEKVYLLDFKCCRTPIALQRRVNLLRKQASDLTLTSDTIGQMELTAYENYAELQKIKVKTAVLTYCPYARPDKRLTCEFIENIKILFMGYLTTQTITGSGTPFVNFDLRKNRSLVDFLCEEHDLEQWWVDELAKVALNQLMERLPSREPKIGERRAYW